MSSVANSAKSHLTTRNHVIQSLVSGSASSAITTVLYQPLELLKTRIQLRHDNELSTLPRKLLGRSTRSAKLLITQNNFTYLWRGTSTSLLRSVPGVGLYYAFLDVLQHNLSERYNKPDGPSQAFGFGLVSRSLVSAILLPVTVVKVRYESGQHDIPKLFAAVKDAYFVNGWIGAGPTILRDSLFSGTYYMCYTQLKSLSYFSESDNQLLRSTHSRNFIYGLVSGLTASIITNPIDVIKTNIQVRKQDKRLTTAAVIRTLVQQPNGYMRLFDGLAPRSLRRTLMAATTWTFYEYLNTESN